MIAILRDLIPTPLRVSLHKQKMRFLGRMFKPYTIIRNFYGRECKISIEDPMSKDWYDRVVDTKEADRDSIEIRLLREGRLKQGSRVFDIGAHQSVVAMKLACLVGSNGNVVSVEANPYNAGIGMKNSHVNQFTNLVVLHGAISDRPGELQFSGEWGDQKVGSGTVKVKSLTIDSLTEAYGIPDVLYIDVEGFECRALAGATETLTTKPDLFIEVHAGMGLESFGGSVKEIFDLLPSDYELLAVKPCRDITEEVAVPFRTDLPWINSRFYLIARHV